MLTRGDLLVDGASRAPIRSTRSSPISSRAAGPQASRRLRSPQHVRQRQSTSCRAGQSPISSISDSSFGRARRSRPPSAPPPRSRGNRAHLDLGQTTLPAAPPIVAPEPRLDQVRRKVRVEPGPFRTPSSSRRGPSRTSQPVYAPHSPRRRHAPATASPTGAARRAEERSTGSSETLTSSFSGGGGASPPTTGRVAKRGCRVRNS